MVSFEKGFNGEIYQNGEKMNNNSANDNNINNIEEDIKIARKYAKLKQEVIEKSKPTPKEFLEKLLSKNPKAFTKLEKFFKYFKNKYPKKLKGKQLEDILKIETFFYSKKEDEQDDKKNNSVEILTDNIALTNEGKIIEYTSTTFDDGRKFVGYGIKWGKNTQTIKIIDINNSIE